MPSGRSNYGAVMRPLPSSSLRRSWSRERREPVRPTPDRAENESAGRSRRRSACARFACFGETSRRSRPEFMAGAGGWRRERDSNPRYGFPYSGFQDHRHRPLGHPSAFEHWPDFARSARWQFNRRTRPAKASRRQPDRLPLYRPPRRGAQADDATPYAWRIIRGRSQQALNESAL